MRPLPLLLLVPALALAGCLGDEESKSTRIKGTTLTIYSSLPFRGASARDAQAVEAGQRLALQDAGGTVGRYTVRLVQLDSSRPDQAGWDPAQVNANAERAADDETAIAYIGELDHGGSAVSLPVTNDAGILQVSPGDGLPSLTRGLPRSPLERPERYYPSGRRNFLRLVPTEALLAEALLDLIELDGGNRVALIRDESIAGGELATRVARRARARGLDPAASVEDRDEPADARGLVEEISERQPDAIVYSGTAGTGFAGILAALARELPLTPVWGGPGLSTAGAPTLAPEQVATLDPVRPPRFYPKHSRKLLRRLEGASPEALYGYEAVRIVLDAVEQVGADRSAVIRHALAPGDREGAIGSYEVVGGGDVSESRYALHRLAGGRFDFERLAP